ncbi:MAG TPA: DHHA1 domain-containing protein, partial [Bacillales bacterium]|nr:DHHA1 domain-containing protein [Bacillales bacterium]
DEILKRFRDNPDTFTLTETENFLLDIEDRKIERYIQSKNRQMVQTFVDEYCVGIVHAEQYLSELGNALNKLNPHLDMIVLLNAGGKKVGFRTIHDHVDVSEFATRFGGGGHPKASGCELTKPAFEKFIVNVFSLIPMKSDADKNERNTKAATYGSCYENRNGDFSFIHPLSNESYEVFVNGKKLDEHFQTYVSAEHYLKRNFVSWLSYDNDLMRFLATKLEKSVEDVKRNYRTLIQTAMINNDKQ